MQKEAFLLNLRLLVDKLGIKNVCKMLRSHPPQVYAWLRGKWNPTQKYLGRMKEIVRKLKELSDDGWTDKLRL